MKTKVLSFLFLCSTFLIFAQHKFLDIPKFNEADLKKEKSTIQEDAPAEILYSSIHNVIDMYTGEMEITVFKRIKIYKKEKASDYLDVEIYLEQDSHNNKETINSLKAQTYNLEDGKVITTPVAKDSKFKSKENKYVTVQKFAFENVKDGSILEFKYIKSTPFIQELPKIYFERDIPVVYEEYILDAPKPYGFNINFQGGLMPKYKEVDARTLYGIDCNTWRLGFENVKPFKEEKFMRNSDNFKSTIRPEINSTYFNNNFKSYAISWDDVRTKLKEYDDFGQQLSKKSVARDLLTPEITNAATPLKKAEEILKFIQKNYTWDESVGIFTRDGVKNLVTTKIGSAAEINLLMVMMMREAGLNANPIILKTVREGVLNISYPSITDPNYVVAGLELDNKSLYVYDGTSKLLEPNLLPPRAYNYNGVLLKDKNAVILDINNTTLSQTFLTVDAKLNIDGSFEGNFKDRDTKLFSVLNNESYQENKENYQKEYKERYTFPYTNIKSGIVNDKDFETSFDFNADSFTDGIGGKLIFNPLLFLYRQNHDFNQTEERKYPIEFFSPYETIKKVTITIPEGYKIENLPKSKKIKTEDDGINYSYVISSEGNKIIVETSVKIDSTDFPKEYYTAFKQIFDVITQYEGQLVTVVKK